jgi:glycerol-3-phosphate dehydrogenase
MYDVCIIGAGGIVGCAIARELALQRLSVIGLEKHDRACRETSGLNSRVIHSGFHEAAGTQKASLAREGSGLILRYAKDRGIPLLHTGMLIAVPYGAITSGLWREATSLWNLWTRGRSQKISFQFLTTPAGVRRIAPIRALGGIFIPSVAVIDVDALAKSLADDAAQAGASFCYGSEVSAIESDASGYRIRTPRSELRARGLINSAGLSAPDVSRMAGGPAYDIELLRGDYYELIGGIERWKIRTLVYPAMPPGSRSKGVHFGPRTNGKLYIGPSASIAPEETPKHVFLDAAQKFLPEVTNDDLKWAYAGIRPKHKGEDFIIRLDRAKPPLVNLIGIDSPGLSASMAIAQYVANLFSRG